METPVIDSYAQPAGIVFLVTLFLLRTKLEKNPKPYTRAQTGKKKEKIRSGKPMTHHSTALCNAGKTSGHRSTTSFSQLHQLASQLEDAS